MKGEDGMAEKSRKSQRARPSGVAYEGRVTAKVMHGGKVVRTIRSKNAGTVPLMRFLAGCLVGNYVPTDRPNYAAALTTNKQENEDLVLEDLVPLSPFPVPSSTATTHSGEVSKSAYATASLSFVMSGLSLGNDKKICGYALYDSRNASSYNAGEGLGTYSALVLLPKDDMITIGSGENLVITWDLTLANADFGEVPPSTPSGDAQTKPSEDAQTKAKAAKAKSRKQG